MVVVTLTWDEVKYAAQCGIARSISGIMKSRQLEEGRNGGRFEQDIVGCIAELATAKHFEMFWSPHVGRLDTHTGDVGQMQCKGTMLRNGCMIVRPRDDARFNFVFATLANLPEVVLVGWLPGVDAKQQKYWREVDKARGVHQAAWFVPPGELMTIESLRS